VRLRRIEVVRFGALEDRTVGDLSDGLTVVHGPNEAGKSTLIAFVRSVLYGFQTRSRPDAYLPRSGERAGRLIVEDEDGQWAIERRDGPKGGPVVVRALRGPDRPSLLAEITHGVDENAYRVVFGFGLDEMARIEEARGDSDSIAGALYAASAGLSVNPDEVRKELESERDALFLPRGEREISKLLRSLAEARTRIKEAREAGQRYAEDRARLEDLERELEELKRQAEEAQGVTRRISADHERVKGALERAEKLAAERQSMGETLAGLRADAASIEVDEQVLSAADDIEALVHRQAPTQQTAQEAERRREQARREADSFERACASAGLSPEMVRAIPASGPLASAVSSARDDIVGLEAEAAARHREHENAEASAERERQAAARALEQAGLDGSATQQDIDRALAEIEAAEESTAHGDRRNITLAAVVALLGLFSSAVGGLWLREKFSLVAGLVFTVLGALALVKELRTGAAVAGGPEIARRRRLLDAARVALHRYESARAEAERARIDATLAEETLAARKELLAQELAKHGLPRDLDARAAAALLEAVREAQRHDAEACTAKAEAERLEKSVDRFVVDVGSVAQAVGYARPVASFEDATSALSVLADRLKLARDGEDRVRAIQAQATQIEAQLSEIARQQTEAESEARAVLERYEQAYASLEGLRAMLEEAQRNEAEIASRREEVASERSRLEERLRALSDDGQAAQARLDEAALTQRIEQAAEEYLVAALGARLLAQAQDLYERERQPDVIKDAEHIFRGITGGRYAQVIVPIRSGRIEVYDDRAAAKDSGKLSKGTAEALYLALRLGLVGRLDGVGPGLPMLIDDVLANFDPERLDGAVQAIADLSRTRQVVFFTCHERIVEMLLEAGGTDAVRIDLSARV
jgi:uncharacterized protein YhaN